MPAPSRFNAQAGTQFSVPEAMVAGYGPSTLRHSQSISGSMSPTAILSSIHSFVFNQVSVALYRAVSRAIRGQGAFAYFSAILNSTPFGYWRLDDVGGQAIDRSGSGFTGTLGGTITPSVIGAIGDGNTAMSFNGIAGRIVLPSIKANLLTSAMSFEAWVNVQPDNRTHITTGSYEQITTRFAPGFNPTLTLYHIVGRFPNIGLTLRDHGTGFAPQSWIGGNATDLGLFSYGTWTHIVVTYQGFGSSSRTVYINGVSQGTDSTGTATDQTGIMRIGEDERWTGYDTGPLGSLDEVAIYQYALSAAQVQDHYTKGIQLSPGLTTAFRTSS